MMFKTNMKYAHVLPNSYKYILVLNACVTIAMCTLESMSNIGFSIQSDTRGMTVTDLDQDGVYEVIIAVADGPNAILQYSTSKNTYTDIGVDEFSPIRDANGRTVAVCACDVDGDGGEEVFLLNKQSNIYPSANNHPNRLIKHLNGTFVDLLTFTENAVLAGLYSGDVVTCIDHDGDGMYAILIGSYREDGSGVYRLLAAVKQSVTTSIVLRDISQVVGLNAVRDGTSVAIGPLVNDLGYSDIFVTNSNTYFLSSMTYRHNKTSVIFRNRGNGQFVDETSAYVREEGDHITYGAAIVDVNDDGTIDIITCSMYGPATIYLRRPNSKYFQQEEGEDIGGFIKPTGCKNLLVADFDNDGNIDLFKDNTQNDGSNNNQMFEVITRPQLLEVKVTKQGINERLQRLSVQETSERDSVVGVTRATDNGHYTTFTCLTLADLNGDGLLEIFVSHKQYGGTTVSVLQQPDHPDNNWLRILPLTMQGAPARGCRVALTLSDYRTITRVVGGACSRACQTEPFVHFGLGNMTSREIEVTWPDGHVIRKFLNDNDNRKSLQISYTGRVVEIKDIVKVGADISAASLTEQQDIPVFTFMFLLCLQHVMFN